MGAPWDLDVADLRGSEPWQPQPKDETERDDAQEEETEWLPMQN